jgi:beta-glucosidase
MGKTPPGAAGQAGTQQAQADAASPPGTSLTAAPMAGAQATAAPSAPAPAFPPGFLWGVATAAYQIEGAPDADGKGPSIWDVYAHMPGKMRNGDTGDVACDHYRRWREDVALIRDLGAGAYRFSIAWPRLFPEGTGPLNPAGLAFYDRLVDALLEAGIKPFPTLYHWDLPQALQARGGWQARATAEAFAHYAATVARHLGDRVEGFFTLNELANFVDMGHCGTTLSVQGRTVEIELAPGLKLPPGELAQVAHHAVLAHGLAVQAMRAAAPRPVAIGPADMLFAGIPAIEAPEHVAAARSATRSFNWRFLDVMLTGRYADAYLEACGAHAPRFTDEELRAIASPNDFVGINLYIARCYVLADGAAPGGWRAVPLAGSHPRMGSPWHSLTPELLYWGPRLLHEIWDVPAIYVTENGCAAEDAMTPQGEVLDTDRLMYLRAAMASLQRACAEGVPVKGCFIWSLMDNLEWTAGFGTRFGLVHVDFATQRRTPKLSAGWFRAASAANALV